MRILIVEDNPSVRRIIDRVLVEDGHDVVGVETGVEGEAVAGRERFDVIILDVMLPDVDGLTVCGNLRQAGVATPILMLTSLSSTARGMMGTGKTTDIRFGRLPHAEGDFVVSPARKVSYVDQYVARNGGRLAGLNAYLDLQYDELHVSTY